jgi:parallel beta helix pectate lyase-like protein
VISTVPDLIAALAAGGDVVCDPTVTLDVTGAGLTITRPTRMLGGTLVATSGPAVTVAASNAELAGLTVTGGGLGTPDPSQKLIYVLGTQADPLTAVRVHDCVLTESASDCLWLEWCTDSGAYHNTCADFLDSGIMVISGNRVAVDDNTITNGVLAAGAANVYGIAITDLLNTDAARSRYCTITGNTVRAIPWEGIDTHGGLGLSITGNTVTACRRGIALVTGNASRVSVPTGCTVTGNTIDGSGASVTPDIGLFLSGVSGSQASAVMSANTIMGYDAGDPISVDFWQRVDSFIGGNSRPLVPWTPITLAGGWTKNPTFPPEYMVDGKLVRTRGAAIPPVGGIAGNPTIGALPDPAAWPGNRSFYATARGSRSTAGLGTLSVDTNGQLTINYGNTSDQFSYWLEGSYTSL